MRSGQPTNRGDSTARRGTTPPTAIPIDGSNPPRKPAPPQGYEKLADSSLQDLEKSVLGSKSARRGKLVVRFPNRPPLSVPYDLENPPGSPSTTSGPAPSSATAQPDGTSASTNPPS